MFLHTRCLIIFVFPVDIIIIFTTATITWILILESGIVFSVGATIGDSFTIAIIAILF